MALTRIVHNFRSRREEADGTGVVGGPPPHVGGYSLPAFRARCEIIGLTLVVWLAAIGVAHAQITLVDIGTATPTPGPNDISQLLTNGNTAATNRSDALNHDTDNSGQGDVGNPDAEMQ